MRYWWVNQGKTYENVVAGGSLWCPKLSSNGNRRVFYDNMLLVEPGDIIFSYANGKIRSAGIALVRAKNSVSPFVLEDNRDGWLLEAKFEPLSNPIRPREHLDRIKDLLPEKYSPISKLGLGNQGAYLASISIRLAEELIFLIGEDYQKILDNLNAYEINLQPSMQSKILKDKNKNNISKNLFSGREKPHKGKFHIITGINGTGKTRYLSDLAGAVLTDFDTISKDYSLIICLSGTIYDKFPLPKGATINAARYIYLGNKTNNNMFSQIAPFRILANLIPTNARSLARRTIAAQILESIGFSSIIHFRFSRTSSEISSDEYDSKEVVLHLADKEKFVSLTESWLDEASSDSIQLTGLRLVKSETMYDLEELSSGEKFYVLTILGLCFCTENDALILFDEPENSLHPKWQTKIIADMQVILAKLSPRATTIVATHSPLIASSAPNINSLVCNFPSEFTWQESELYGKNSDAVLETQFELLSPRSLTVTSIIQECLRFLVMAQHKPSDFINAADRLAALEINFAPSDPLFSTVAEILKIRRELQ